MLALSIDDRKLRLLDGWRLWDNRQLNSVNNLIRFKFLFQLFHRGISLDLGRTLLVHVFLAKFLRGTSVITTLLFQLFFDQLFLVREPQDVILGVTDGK